MSRMSMREFKELVRHVMETLPPEIAEHAGNVVVDVVAEPDEEILRDMAGFTEDQIQEGQSLFGLHEPFPGVDVFGIDIADRPSRLWIFKDPHEDEFPDPTQLRIEVRKTVIHELAHHFGFDESDLERFDANPNPFGE